MHKKGKYRRGERLGGGGMAEVYRATLVGAEGFARAVAIKHMLPSLSADVSFAEMFVNEARLASRLSHPNIVSILDFDRDEDDHLFIVMELVEGRDLRDLWSAGPIPVPVAAYVVGELLRALAYAHALQDEGRPVELVHRDVSPHNVLLSWDGAVKLSDFGIAKAAAHTSITKSGVVKGKLGYLCPEQIEGGRIDGRVDLYATGVLLHEMMTGRRLYSGVPERDALRRILTVTPPSPRSVVPSLPESLSAFCVRLLERDRDRRPADAQAALMELIATGLISPHGQIELARLMSERFPGEAPSAIWRALDGGSKSTPVPRTSPTLPAQEVSGLLDMAPVIQDAERSPPQITRGSPERGRADQGRSERGASMPAAGRDAVVPERGRADEGRSERGASMPAAGRDAVVPELSFSFDELGRSLPDPYEEPEEGPPTLPAPRQEAKTTPSEPPFLPSAAPTPSWEPPTLAPAPRRPPPNSNESAALSRELGSAVGARPDSDAPDPMRDDAPPSGPQTVRSDAPFLPSRPREEAVTDSNPPFVPDPAARARSTPRGGPASSILGGGAGQSYSEPPRAPALAGAGMSLGAAIFRRASAAVLGSACALGLWMVLIETPLKARDKARSEARAQSARGQPVATPRALATRIDSTPSGAKVWVDREAEPRGVTPLLIQLPSGAAASIRVQKEGYSTATGVAEAGVALVMELSATASDQ